MKKTFLVMTDPEKGAREDNWTIMNAFEFARFMETEEGQKRKNHFERLDALDEDDDILIMECSTEQAMKVKSERNRADYCQRVKTETGFETMSLDGTAFGGDEEEILLIEMIADEAMDTEEQAVKEILKAEIPAAMEELSKVEQDLIRALYMGDEKMTVNRYSNLTGRSRNYITAKHQSAIRKLRLHYRKKRLL